MNRPAQVFYTNKTPTTPLPISSIGTSQGLIHGATPVNLASYLEKTIPVAGRIDE